LKSKTREKSRGTRNHTQKGKRERERACCPNAKSVSGVISRHTKKQESVTKDLKKKKKRRRRKKRKKSCGEKKGAEICRKHKKEFRKGRSLLATAQKRGRKGLTGGREREFSAGGGLVNCPGPTVRFGKQKGGVTGNKNAGIRERKRWASESEKSGGGRNRSHEWTAAEKMEGGKDANGSPRKGRRRLQLPEHSSVRAGGVQNLTWSTVFRRTN